MKKGGGEDRDRLADPATDTCVAPPDRRASEYGGCGQLSTYCVCPHHG